MPSQVHPQLRLDAGALSVTCDMLSEMLRSLLAAAAEATHLHQLVGREGLTEVPAGAEDEEGALTTDQSASLHVPRSSRQAGWRGVVEDGGTVRVIGEEAVRDAIRAVLHDELLKHGLCECAKALGKYSKSHVPQGGVGAMAKRAGLQVGVKEVADHDCHCLLSCISFGCAIETRGEWAGRGTQGNVSSWTQ